MTLKEQMRIGYQMYPKAIKFVFAKKLAWTLVFPVLFNIVLLAGGITLINSFVDDIQHWVSELIRIENAGWNNFFSGLVAVLINILFFIVYILISGFLILTLMAPVFGYLSEKTEKIVTGKDFPGSFMQLIKDLFRGTLLAFRNMIIELLTVILMFFVGLIPVVGWIIAPIVTFIVSSYFYGFGFMDCSNERRRFSIRQSIHIIRRYKGIAIANGSVFAVFLFIPFCGASIAAFVGVFSAVAASLAMIEVSKTNTRLKKHKHIQTSSKRN